MNIQAETNPAQSSVDPNNCEQKSQELLKLIQSQVDRTPHRRLDPDEIINEVYVRLIEKSLPTLENEELQQLIQKTVEHAIRDLKRFSRPAMDVGELDPDEQPSYDMREEMEDRQFEEAFALFCESQPEPKRTIYRRSRTNTRKEIAKHVNLSPPEIGRVLKAMPEKFRLFLKKGRD